MLGENREPSPASKLQILAEAHGRSLISVHIYIYSTIYIYIYIYTCVYMIQIRWPTKGEGVTKQNWPDMIQAESIEACQQTACSENPALRPIVLAFATVCFHFPLWKPLLKLHSGAGAIIRNVFLEALHHLGVVKLQLPKP